MSTGQLAPPVVSPVDEGGMDEGEKPFSPLPSHHYLGDLTLGLREQESYA